MDKMDDHRPPEPKSRGERMVKLALSKIKIDTRSTNETR